MIPSKERAERWHNPKRLKIEEMIKAGVATEEIMKTMAVSKSYVQQLAKRQKLARAIAGKTGSL